MRVGRKAPSRALFLQWCPCIRLGITEGTRARLMNIPVATAYWSGYRSHVAANSATGRRNPSKQKAHSAPFRLQALFFASAFLFYGGCAWADFGLAGTLLPRYSYPTHSCHPIP